MNRFLLPFFMALVLAGCGSNGLREATPEEQSDTVAAASADSIHAVQRTAKRLHAAGSLPSDDYQEILEATIDLTVLTKRIEDSFDHVDGLTEEVGCVKVSLDGVQTDACNREDVTEVLVKIRGKLDGDRDSGVNPDE